MMHGVGTSAVLPVATKADLVDGTATIPNVAPSPAPVSGQVPWAYAVKVLDRFGKQFEWLVGVPDGVPPINFVDLPRYFETQPPLFGEGPVGPPGEGATIEVGTVASGPTPTVTNVGTTTNAKLNFVFPKGDKGDKGDNSTYIGLNNKLFTDAPSTYPNGMSTHRGTAGSGWGATVGVTTSYSGAAGTGWQIVKDYLSDSIPTIRWATGGTVDTWTALVPLTYTVATTLVSGLMSATDKVKLDANNTLAPDTKLVNEGPLTYPEGISVTRGTTGKGWPYLNTISTLRDRTLGGGSLQFVKDTASNANPPQMRWTQGTEAGWSNLKTMAFVEEMEAKTNLNFLDYGGVNDGITDNSPALTEFLEVLNVQKRIGYIPNGTYILKRFVSFTGLSDIGLVGESKHGTKFLFRPDGVPSSPTPFSGVGPTRVTLKNFTLDGGRAQHLVNGHSISFRNSESCLFDNLFIVNHGNAAIMNFAENADAGLYGNNVISNTEADGLNQSNNGFLYVNMHNCYYINVTAKNGGKTATHTPSSGIQFKNRCVDSHIINCTSISYKDGFGLGGDTDNFGPTNNTLIGAYAYDCSISLSMGSAVGNQIEVFSNKATQNDIRLSANCADNVISASIDATTKSGASVYFGSNYNTVEVKYVPNGIAKLATFVVGSRYNKLMVSSRYASAGGNLTSLVENLSEYSTNYVGSNDALYRTQNLVADGTTLINFNDASGKQNYLAHTGTSKTFSFRSDNANIFTVSPNDMTAGTDNTMSLGTSVRRYTQVYAANASISTSDEREKRDISTKLEPELRAWAKIGFVKFKWKEAVNSKGKKARWHFGLIAQDVKKAFESEGLDPFEYGILCYDEWESQPAEYDDEGEEISPAIEAGNRYGVRYEEALALECAYLRTQLNR